MKKFILRPDKFYKQCIPDPLMVIYKVYNAGYKQQSSEFGNKELIWLNQEFPKFI